MIYKERLWKEEEEMEEFWGTLVNTQILKVCIESNVGLYMFTIVPAFFTCFGISFRNIWNFLRFNKNRRAYKYVLLNKIRDESLVNYMKKLLVFGFELYIFLINMWVIIGVAELFILFVSMRTGVIGYNISYCIIILILSAIVVVMAFAGKYEKSRRLKGIRVSAFVLCEGILCIMWITFGVREIKVFRGGLLLVSLLLIFSIIFTVHKSEIFSGNMCLGIKVVRMIRYFILIVYTIIYFMDLHFLDNDMLWVIWSLSCYFEYIWMLTHDDINRVSVILHTKLGEKITRDRIIQYESDKIGYILLDGKVEIIDNDEVEAITYQINHLLFKGNVGKRRVMCKLRSGKPVEFQNYRLVNDTWVKFIKDKNRTRDVLMVKIKDTERIVEEKY